jgi:hypothetical protein
MQSWVLRIDGERVKHSPAHRSDRLLTAELRPGLVEELERLHQQPRLLKSFIRHASIPIRLPTETGQFRLIQ